MRTNRVTTGYVRYHVQTICENQPSVGRRSYSVFNVNALLIVRSLINEIDGTSSDRLLINSYRLTT